jgi:hypothetical protein
MPVFQFNSKYSGTVAIVKAINRTFVIKASSQDEWDEIIERFESLTDALDSRNAVLDELDRWVAVPKLSRMGSVLRETI